MFLDTSGLYCYLVNSDVHHPEAVAYYEAATQRLTHNYVLAELVALCHARKYSRRKTLDFVQGILRNPQIVTVWVTQPLHNQALALLQKQLDKTYSLCDAVSFQLMQQTDITECLTTDHHFEQAGFIRLLK